MNFYVVLAFRSTDRSGDAHPAAIYVGDRSGIQDAIDKAPAEFRRFENYHLGIHSFMREGRRHCPAPEPSSVALNTLGSGSQPATSPEVPVASEILTIPQVAAAPVVANPPAPSAAGQEDADETTQGPQLSELIEPETASAQPRRRR